LAAAAMVLVAFVRVSPALVVTAAAAYGLLARSTADNGGKDA